ncbi:PKD domain-containing protein [Candidatus Woesearchaeota archaeon]|nr:PKD domain-containing protein [Candidatus Woesearchaeota archaeon]
MKLSLSSKQVFLFILVLTLFSLSSLALPEFKAKEGDLVKLNIKATDLDQDRLTYIYPDPFNKQGEWQTTYGDTGTYSVEVVVTDGKNEVRKHIRLIIEKRNRPPFLKETRIKAKEEQTIDLKSFVDDPDQDPLTYSFPSPFNHNGLWKTKHGDAGYKVIEFSFSDGEFIVKKKVSIEVLPTNQPPFIQDLFSDKSLIQYNEGDMAEFYVQARDPDDEGLTYKWILDNITLSEKNTANYHFLYNSRGSHFLSLIISDSKIPITRNWEILVNPSNRPPEFKSEIITIKEGELVQLDLPTKDLDGDSLSYIIPPPFNEKGIWQTNYNDAGTKIFIITVSDGTHSIKYNTTIIIANVNRPPVLTVPAIIDISEGQKLNWNMDVFDPDNDTLRLSLKNLPWDASLDEKNKSFSWQPGYETIKRKGGMASNILNALRLERFFLKDKRIPLEIQACDQEFCVNGSTSLLVHNVNLRPKITPPGTLTLTATENIKYNPVAIDNDGDILHFYFTPPLDKRNGDWQTSYDSTGTYTTYVTATDGQLQDTIPVRINVLKKNRAPRLEIASDDVTVNENIPFQLTVTASDSDGDNVTLFLKNSPLGSSFNEGIFLWTPSYDSVLNRTANRWNDIISSSSYLNKKLNDEQTVVWLEFAVFDGEIETIHPVKVTIKNVNRPPRIVQTFPQPIVEVQANEPFTLQAVADDQDNDPISYSWNFGIGEATVMGTNTIERTFTVPGDKKVIVTISDGRDSVSYEWQVHVTEETNIPSPPPPTGDYKVYVITT